MKTSLDQADKSCQAARGSTEFYPLCEMWDEVAGQGETDLSRAGSWFANLQMIEVVGVGAGVAALVSSLLPLFYR